MTDDPQTPRIHPRATAPARGHVHPAYAGVAEAFARVLESDAAGAALSIVVDGETVVDLWGGADPLSGRAWERESATLAFSAAKGMVALLVAQQVQAGALDPALPVAHYWPEFAAAGKERITVADVLTHVAGMPTLPIREPEDLLDPLALAARVAAAPPDYAPPQRSCLPRAQLRRHRRRAAPPRHRGRRGDPAARTGRRSAGCGALARAAGRRGPSLPPRSHGADRAAARAGRYAGVDRRGLRGRLPQHGADRPVVRTGRRDAGHRAGQRPLLPTRARSGGGLVADARALARVYGACVAPVDGVRLLDDDTVGLVSRDWLGGIREPLCLPGAAATVRWGLGFEISHALNRMLGDGSFGHSGMGGRLAFAHAPSRTGFAFVGQRMTFPAPGQDPRWALLLDALAAV